VSSAAAIWESFLREAGGEIERLQALGVAPTPEALRRAAGGLFAVRTGAALVGVEPIARAAAALESALLEAAAAGSFAAHAAAIDGCARAIAAALTSLARPDPSGARVEDPAALERAVVALHGPAPAARPTAAAAPPAPTPGSDDARWVPEVDVDMIDPFLEEAAERIEALSQKLLRLESSPGDGELVRDVFRDLHTLKGSSGFVGLRRMKQLAHAAEDLVGQVRDGARAVDRPLIDALLGALDGLRALLDGATAAAGQLAAPGAEPPRIEVPIEPYLARLRAPTARAVADANVPESASAPPPDAAPKHTLRVDFDKLDTLLNLVGELVLTKAGVHASVASVGALGRELDLQLRRQRQRRGARLTDFYDDLERTARIFAELTSDLQDGASALDHVAGELRQQVMKLRMLPIARVFTKYQRTVRELAHVLGKQVRLEIVGAETELDKILVEQLDDPLLHLVRNAVDHGVEPPAARAAAGKPVEGVVTLRAQHRGNQIVVQVSDDGAGLDPARLRKKALEKQLATPEEVEGMDEKQVLDLIFRPGFSTAARITDVSGRGVGMDVVRATVQRLSGTIELASRPGDGTTFTIKLPLTLAILQVLLVRADGADYALPLDTVVRTLAVPASAVHRVYDREVLLLPTGDDGAPPEQVPLVWLADALELGGARAHADELSIILVDAAGEVYGLVVERLVGKRETVLKSLGELLQQVPCAAGATLIGDRVAVILDVVQVVQRGLLRPTRPAAAPAPVAATAAAPSTSRRRPRVLVAEDSDAVRETLKRLFEAHGCEVVPARDGAEALALAERDPAGFDLVSTDVMMPAVDGYQLARALRAQPRHREVPIVMVTSRTEDIDRVRGFDAGVDEYLTKPLDAGDLARALERHLKGRLHS
jgi:two-component system chemotaxis sensor kinase CheA